MAVRCEFIDIIVPIANIDRVYPGGFATFKRENARMFGGRLWHDDHLFRDGAMSPRDVEQAVDFWRHQGLEPTEIRDGRQVWKDLCVVEHMLGGPTLPCAWLEFDRERACVYLKGAPSEPVVGRESFESTPGEETMSDDDKAWLSRMMPGGQRDEIENASGEFGYEKSNPIPADGTWYCSRLRCPSRHPYWFHRLGSLGRGPDGHIIDRVELLCFGRENHIQLFFDMYHSGASARVPQGLSLSSPDGRGTMRGIVLDFPNGLEPDTG